MVLEAITCRPADLLKSEMDELTTDLLEKAKQKVFLAEDTVDDVLTYALFLRGVLSSLRTVNPEAFEPAPTAEAAALWQQRHQLLYLVGSRATAWRWMVRFAM